MGMRNSVLSALGLIFVFLGVVGIFVPLLPTTPFLLLAAFCFSKSHKGLYGWMMNHKNFESTLRDWQERRVIQKKSKILAVSMILVSAIIILIFAAAPLWSRILSVLVMLGVSVFIMRQRSS